MTIQDIKNLDFYTCSLQDINKAHKALSNYLKTHIKGAHSIQNEWKGSDFYIEVKKLHVMVSRARIGMGADGYMIQGVKPSRLPNSKSFL